MGFSSRAVAHAALGGVMVGWSWPGGAARTPLPPVRHVRVYVRLLMAVDPAK